MGWSCRTFLDQRCSTRAQSSDRAASERMFRAHDRGSPARAGGSRRRGGGRRPIVGDLFESEADRNNGYTTTV
jgi:hypothetical protein